jgi:penicillin-binding protein 2
MSDNERHNQVSINRRAALLGSLGAGVFGVLSSRLYYLQILKAEDYRALSDDNRFNFNITIPSRGRILDRYGNELAINSQIFSLVLIPERVKDIEATLLKLKKILSLSTSNITRIKKNISKHASFVPVLIKENLDWGTFSKLNFKTPDFPGVIPQVGLGRSYPNDGLFSHTIGYVGSPSPKDLEDDKDPLLKQPSFKIGKTGIESSADKLLRGSSGKLKVEVNASGRTVREFPNSNDAPINGQDIWLTLDSELQKKAAELFGNDSGGIVVMDVLTGEIRTMLSMPTFNGNLFVSGITQKQMDELNNDERRPQYNKVLAGGYPPASTFKMVVMLAALEGGFVDPKDKITCRQKVNLGNRTFHCWKRGGHGPVNMREALKNSCDVYFYELSQKVGIENIASMGRRLGFGEKFNIGLNGLKSGIMPDPKWKKLKLGNSWKVGDTLNASIGQGFVLSTPLQMAVMVARLANGKDSLTPNLIIGQNLLKFKSLDIDSSHIAFVQKSMLAVCEEPGGTAYKKYGLDLGQLQIAGKTGTGQVRGISEKERRSKLRRDEDLPWKLRDHNVFVGYAPFKKPRFAVSCLVEHGGTGSKRAIEISRNILKTALIRDGIPEGKKIKSAVATDV